MSGTLIAQAQGPASSSMNFRPIVTRRASFGILRGDEFEIGAVGEAGESHFREAVRMLAAILGMNAERIELGAHSLEIAAADGDVIDAQIGGDSRGREERKEYKLSLHDSLDCCGYGYKCGDAGYRNATGRSGAVGSGGGGDLCGSIVLVR